MRRSTARLIPVAVCLFSVLRLSATAEGNGAGEASVGTLQSLVSEWVDLRLQAAAEKREWDEKKRHWVRETELLEKERAALEQELAETDAEVTSAEEKRAGLLEERDRLQRSFDALAPLLDRAEADLRRWTPRIPPPLQTDLLKLLAQLPRTQAEAEAVPATRRLQVVVALYTHIETLQQAVRVTRELLPVDSGKRRELDVLYLGLARGFAVSGDDLWAAVGVPHEAGWTWTPQPGLAAAVRHAISVADSQTPAELVSLPVGVLDPEEGTAP